MSPQIIFNLHLILGYVAWLLCFSVYILPRLKSMDLVAAQRAIATLHSPLASLHSPPTGTLQPGCSPSWRFSL
jgi:hypothetical protein